MTPSDPRAAAAKSPARFRFFSPILAGATLGERLLACLGAVAGIGATALLTSLLLGDAWDLPLIVAPMGATAVLLFAVPASPLAQPWPIVFGNTLSALVGVAAAHIIQPPLLAVSVAVGLAILLMSLTRSLHPPGGAVALLAALGGPSVIAYGWLFPLLPVALNCLVLLLCGLAFHRATGRAYPHRPVPAPAKLHQTEDRPPPLRSGFRAEDVDAALAALGETFDVDRDDLEALLRRVEQQALQRVHGPLKCRHIMSRDVIKATLGESAEQARTLLLMHNIRTLPVVDEERRLVGTLGLREIASGGAPSPATTAKADDLVASLVPVLTDGRTHAVIVVDDERRVLGLISQTDLLAALARPPLQPVA